MENSIILNLSAGTIISEGIKITLKNIGSLLGATLLWLITIWIPYVNIGTTIALSAIVVSMSKGFVITPTEIFKPHYRQYMGEYFLLSGLMFGGIIVGYVLFYIPGIVISIAWSQAIFLLIDKGINPMEAIVKSNKLTYGYKWNIFLSLLFFTIIYLIAYFIIAVLINQISSILSFFLIMILTLLFVPFLWGLQSYIYSELNKKFDATM